MRIPAHHAVALDPIRTNPGRVATGQPAPSASAMKPTFLASPTATGTSSFASLFSTIISAPAAAPTTAVSTTAPAAAAPAAAPAVQAPGIQAFVSAIINGTFQASYVTDPTQLKETTPIGTDTMPNVYYASDQTASQMAQLLGGKVVRMPAFGQDAGWTEPDANFIQLPNGQTFNAADVAYYAMHGVPGSAQLTADITGAINAGSAWSNWYKSGGPLPSFPTGYIGPPISGMDYPAGSIGADGNVINPAMQGTTTNT
jgi:hypothetical protein